ncbi:hypothetical protein TNCV_2122021 [Trichonephila clavipes]|nr:hypothetical protein TNCV_2122021 [Trichonephila clavipes]
MTYEVFLAFVHTLEDLLKVSVISPTFAVVAEKWREFHWGPEEVEAFNSLKKALTGSSIGDVRRKSFYRNPY